jgi:hypothetical protein
MKLVRLCPQFLQVSVAGPQCHLCVSIVEQDEEKVFQRGVFVPLRGGAGQGGLQGTLKGNGQHGVSHPRVIDLLPYGVRRLLAVRRIIPHCTGVAVPGSSSRTGQVN